MQLSTVLWKDSTMYYSNAAHVRSFFFGHLQYKRRLDRCSKDRTTTHHEASAQESQPPTEITITQKFFVACEPLQASASSSRQGATPTQLLSLIATVAKQSSFFPPNVKLILALDMTLEAQVRALGASTYTRPSIATSRHPLLAQVFALPCKLQLTPLRPRKK